jgi:precorrin-6Y C5,15-methyltransferase (decarboxylating)
MKHHLYIHIVGLGVTQRQDIASDALSVLETASCVIGSQRQLALVADLTQAKTVILPKLSELKALISAINNDFSDEYHVVVLASGDPLFYGIGRWFTKNFDTTQLCFYPAVSSIQAACHKQGLALQDVTVVSLHGRPLVSIRTELHNKRILVVLTDRLSNPSALADECNSAGFSDSIITVHENLGYPETRSTRFMVGSLLAEDHHFDPLNICVIEVKGSGGLLPEFPGISDDLFATGKEPGRGMISKREVRLAILSLMQIEALDVVWDIGAGCGSVAVELAYWQPSASIYAVEYHPERLPYLNQNRQRFGVVKNLTVIEGKAPDALVELPNPNKIFIGGSDGRLDAMLAFAWNNLPNGGVLVASAVVDGSKLQLHKFAKELVGATVEAIELGVKRGQLQQGDIQYEAKLPVEIFKFQKGDV